MNWIRRALSIRVRLTVAIAAALLFVLALLGLFVYLRVGSDLNNQIDDGLTSRAEVLVSVADIIEMPRLEPRLRAMVATMVPSVRWIGFSET